MPENRPKPNPFLESKACNICGSEEHKTVHFFEASKYPHDTYETASWDGRQNIELRIVKCGKCGLIYTNPAFKENSLHHVYPNDLVNIQDTSSLLENDSKYLKFFTLCKSHMTGTTVCDIGTRYGIFPLIAEKKGFKAIGIEYNAAAVAVGKQLSSNVFQGGISDLLRLLEGESLSQIDNFFMDDVIEHLADPLRDLKILSSLQKPGGRLFLRQMDTDSLGYRLFRANWYYLQPAAHMYYFNETSIKMLLGKAGYRIIGIKRAPLLPNLVNTLKSYLRNMSKMFSATSRSRLSHGKHLYLSKRFRSKNDMFIVIAEKQTAL